jgi:hypothetical protein
MKSYSINLNFITSKELTEDELGLLFSQVMAQVEEPTDEEGSDAKYHTLILSTESTIKENK